VSDPSNNLERLVTRYLDQECSPEERKQLHAMLRKDSAAAEFLEETADVDRELNFVLRRAMGRPPVRRLPAPFWSRMGRLVGFGMAAALVGLVWMSSWSRSSEERGASRDGARTNAASWFAPAPALTDTLVEDAARFGVPQVRLERPSETGSWFRATSLASFWWLK